MGNKQYDRGGSTSASNTNFGGDNSLGYTWNNERNNYGPDRNYNERGGYSENEFSPDFGFNNGRYRTDEGFNNYRDWRSAYGNDYLNYRNERVGERAGHEFSRSTYKGRRDGGSRSFEVGGYRSEHNKRPSGHEGKSRRWWDKAFDEVSSWFGNEEVGHRRALDKKRTGQHKGKVPKGRHKSDDRIKEEISDRLTDDVFIDATEIEVIVSKGEVILRGIVSERFEKRRAEDLVQEVSGVQHVENRIQLRTLQPVGQTNTTSSI